MIDYLFHHRLTQCLVSTKPPASSQQQQLNANHLSKRQQKTLQIALWAEEKLDEEVAPQVKQLLLRAFAVYRRRDRLSADTLARYRHHLKQQFRECLTQTEHQHLRRSPLCFTRFPYYLSLLLDEPSHTPLVAQKTQNQRLMSDISGKGQFALWWTHHHRNLLALVKVGLANCTNHAKTVKLKQGLGSISLIPIKIGKRGVKVRNVWIHYHDLYHLEVAQLDRIQMGNYWVSGVNGINGRVFHDAPIVEEYDSFLDEARIAIHESLTRPSAFSQLKLLCWLGLLLIQGINPWAVIIRHTKSLKKKQAELWL
ncbi:hypothetical protein [Trichocoleus sp. FACHB-591]|uniref:hypothetical protein n=1 Tax=Trichocoleus sp. FACHB-591 TaxID=2692872 RepID=UPI0018EFB77E|nr:hypothetical protein [Trichocoleus sp. FACHB-591]